eukprot:m.204398 g.204398  ORF g.204398 m.204398 type:complete len:60 (+) comp15386_c0_seq2:1924-2103(+)
MTQNLTAGLIPFRTNITFFHLKVLNWTRINSLLEFQRIHPLGDFFGGISERRVSAKNSA